MTITVKTYNEILGDMIRKVIADTPLNDLNVGSVLLTLLEAAAANDFENNAAILSVLELLSLDAVRNNDLDARGADLGLTRILAQKSTGQVSISDSAITKRSTGLYQIKPSPIVGSTVIYVNDASTWNLTGNFYIGRGTASYEGPIPYTNIVNNGSFFTIQLSTALQKDHLISDVVIDAQGTVDRMISAGTTIVIPANNQNPAINFVTLRNITLPAGEDTVSNIDIIALLAGSSGNAGINTITQFATPPFTTATVTNTSALTDGRDIETDTAFRERIKSYTSTLARGTSQAILNAIIGVSDTSDSKQVVSATITEPTEAGKPAIVYLDDSRGFQPSYTGQSVDVLLGNATGNEEFLQLANYPLPRAQVVNTLNGPFELIDGSFLRILIDGIEETITFSTADFVNIASATLAEVIIAINNQSNTFKATFTQSSSRLLLFPIEFDVETIQVSTLKDSDDETLYANNSFKFPTNELSHIRLYQNNTLLKEKQKAATLLTTPYSTWNITASGNIIFQVDGTPAQNQSFDTTDFGGIPFNALSLEDWIRVFNTKFAGITASQTASGNMLISSNKIGSGSLIEVLGGSYFNKWFNNLDTSATGQNSDFQLNRQNGNIRILTPITINDVISAGAEDTKGNVISSKTVTGRYNVATDAANRPAEMILLADSKNVYIRTSSVVAGISITITDEGNDTMRIMANSVSAFANIQPLDFVYITSRGIGTWIDTANCGLYKIISKGDHLTAGIDSFIEVKNVTIVPGAGHIVQAGEDIQFFKADKYPQLWKGIFTTTPASATIQDVVDSFNNNIVNIKASIFKTDSIKVTSTTETDGSIATPISVGNAAILLDSGVDSQLGNQSHMANKVAAKDAIAFFKRTVPTDSNAGGITGRNVWLNRVTYNDIKGSLTTSSIPNTGIYSDSLISTGILNASNVDYDDYINLTSGANKSQYRTVRDLLPADTLGTQVALPKTLMDHTINDQFNLLRPSSLSSEDSIIFILDQDSVAKTITIPMSRTGKINTSFIPTNISFSADDKDNEPGITFSNLQVWSKTANKTEFMDYAVWFRAHNWYSTGGATSGGAQLVLRAKEYGPHGEQIRFALEYPTLPNKVNTVTHINTPTYTQATYYFGSGAERTINDTAGTLIQVTSLGSYNFRYTFVSPGITLATTLVGDILSMLPDSGISSSNRGLFRINAVSDITKTIDIYNPNGVANIIGQPEITKFQTIADVLGTSTIFQLTADTDIAGALDGKYFIIYDEDGSVAVWYDLTGTTPEPAHGQLRSIQITGILAGDSGTQIASVTSAIINGDSKFTAGSAGALMTITTIAHGVAGSATIGTTGWITAPNTTTGTVDVSLDSKFFKFYDQNGSVAFWYNVTGSAPEPLHGCDRSVQIFTVVAGDSANNVATKTGTVIDNDAEFLASVVGDEITVTDAFNGVRVNATAETSGFDFTSLGYGVIQQGIDDTYEIITTPTSFMVYPLANNAANDIASILANNDIIDATINGDGSLLIEKATREEVYTPAGPGDYSVSLGYGHNPDPASNLNAYIKLYDSLSWVKDYSNLNPNFALKTALLLQGVAPTAYSMDTTPNYGISDLGEFFKLIPVSLNNLYHHFTHKALSQLPIVADVGISNNIRKIQIKSKQLGSIGAVEIVGGNANNVSFSILDEAQIDTVSSIDYGSVLIASNPVTFTKDDIILIENTNTSKRYSRLTSSDSIDVVKGTGDDVRYLWNNKSIFISPFTRFQITDVSASYFRSAGTVWRWQHNDGGSFLNITDNTSGVAAAPYDRDILEAGDATNLEEIVDTVGALGVNQQVRLTVSGSPSDGDFYLLTSADGNTFAVWYSVDGSVIVPAGPIFTGATFNIKVAILSTDTENQVIAKLSSVLTANANFNISFTGYQISGTTLANVIAGDLLNAFGTFNASWSHGNMSRNTGDGEVCGLPIVNVNAASKYIDVVNTNGQAMAWSTVDAGEITITPTPIIKWNLNHSAKTNIVSVIVNTGTATCLTSTPHGLRIGDTISISDNIIPTSAVLSVISLTSFTFSTAAIDGTYTEGSVINSTKVVTRYKIEDLGFNSMFRLVRVSGDSPKFIDCGVAVDDLITIDGTTFSNNNNGTFRVLSIDDDSIVYQNTTATEELHTILPFNNLLLQASWTSNSDIITGVAGTFKNLIVGNWVKKSEDDETFYKQVTQLTDSLGVPTTAALATRIVLGSNYKGTTALAEGVAYNTVTGVNAGVYLQDINDIVIYEGDSVRTNDSIFVDKIINANWFNPTNCGTFSIVQFGTDGTTHRPYIKIANTSGISQVNRLMSVNLLGFFILEGTSNYFKTIRVIEHTAVDEINSNYRKVYFTPATTTYKMSRSNGTKVTAMGKLEYTTDISTGIDGYTYYTGLMRTVQRVIDGFEPDPINYPGRRAVGGLIECLGPLIKRISISISVTTNDGVNLNEISNDIKSAIINYISNAGVGEDIIMSEIIVRVMGISGVAAVTFNTPAPSTERISISDNEKGFIELNDISIA